MVQLLACESFDDIAEQDESQIGVLDFCAGRVVQRFRQQLLSHIRGSFCFSEEFAMRGKSRSVQQQLSNSNSVAPINRLTGTAAWRQVTLDGNIQIDLLLRDQHHDRGGGDDYFS